MTDQLLWLLPVICLLACGLTLWFDTQSQQQLKLKTKLLASLAFVGFAWDLGAGDSLYGQLLLTGLVLSLAGDVLLAKPGNKRWFVCGMAAFLLAHMAYAIAFSTMGSVTARLPLVLPLIVLLVLGIGLWLRNYLSGVFKVAVPAYLLAIGTMLVMAWLVPTSIGQQQLWIVAGASLFALSDVWVARNRFTEPAFVNRLVGLPLYYVAQLLLAYSVKTVGI